MTELFADRTEFRKLDKNNLDRTNSITNLLKNVAQLNRGEINDDVYNNIRPQSTKPARSHGLPQTHKTFENLPPFRTVIDTTGTAYQPIARYLSCLLNPLTHNEFNLRGMDRIKNIPNNLFTEGYRFISFDVKSFFTTIPLKVPMKRNFLRQFSYCIGKIS